MTAAKTAMYTPRKYEAMNGAGGKHTPKTGGNPEMRNESSITAKK